MATEAQTAANRANAQHSSGPRTATGKESSSRNALSLGLYTSADYVKPEERNFYEEFCQTMYNELNPASLLEESCANEIVGANWRLRRAAAAEADLGDFDDATDKTRRSIERARAAAQLVINRAFSQLRKLQALSPRTQCEEKEAPRAPVPNPMDDIDRAMAAIMSNPGPSYADLFDPAPPASLPGEDFSGQTGSNCKQSEGHTYADALTKRNRPCACKSGRIFRKCCGQNEPAPWQPAA